MKTGIAIEKVDNGFVVRFVGDSTKLFSQNTEINQLRIAKTEKEVIELVKKMIPELDKKQTFNLFEKKTQIIGGETRRTNL